MEVTGLAERIWLLKQYDQLASWRGCSGLPSPLTLVKTLLFSSPVAHSGYVKAQRAKNEGRDVEEVCHEITVDFVGSGLHPVFAEHVRKIASA